MNYLSQFIEQNRQTGTTTALLKLAIETNGYLIVSTHEIRNHLYNKMNDNDRLSCRIITLNELKSVSFRGINMKKAPVYFDTDAVLMIKNDVNVINNVCNSITVTDDGIKIDSDKSITITGNTILDKENSQFDKQINVKLTDNDMKEINFINSNFFENEASNSMIGRILLRKGIAYFKNMLNFKHENLL